MRVLAARQRTRQHRRVGLTRRVAIVTYPGIQALDLVGPMEVFDVAAQLVPHARAERPYEIEVVAREAGPIVCSSGLQLEAQRALRQVRRPLDTLIVAGGQGSRAAAQDRALVAAIRRISRRARRVASVCTGAFVLGAAGLLDGRRATTHWRWCAQLQAAIPAARVDAEPIFVRDGNVFTSAGVTAGMDLALALVEDDLGPELALQTARYLVLFVRRPGGQAQFSAQLGVMAAERRPLRELLAWLSDHLAEDLSVARLSARAGMSPRNFARAFRHELGVTPGAYVERARLEAARRLLESTQLDVEAVAAAVGLGSGDSLRRAFARRLSVSPSEYRRRFAARAPSSDSEVFNARAQA